MEKESLYYQPKIWEELMEILPELTGDSVVLAGGTDLLTRLRHSEKEPDCYLSLWEMEELRHITLEQGALKIGAMVTHAAAAAHPLVRQYFNGLAMACSHVGSQQIRNKGTLCGSIANASPAGDIMPCVFLYRGEIEVTGPGGRKRVKAEDFLGETGKARLDAHEVITAVYLPVCDGLRSCFVKLGSRKEVTIAQISLCAAWKDGGEENREANGGLRAYVGAVDVRPLVFDGEELLAAAEDEDAAEREAGKLSAQIRAIRMRRKRESKLKLTEAEKLYKERAARGIVYNFAEAIKRGEF